ncbi:MAG: hypothetical protein KY459_05345 [Acidobacteria bacterium]|nr:hypothetical protein [Acidobacteriota bacterium]
MAGSKRIETALIAALMLAPGAALHALQSQDQEASEAGESTRADENEQTSKESGRTEAASADRRKAATTPETRRVQPARSPESRMVRAAKSASESKGARISLTNADLDKTKGTLIVLEGSGRQQDDPPAAATKKDPEESRKAVTATVQAARTQALREKQRKLLTDKIAEIEARLARYEDEFYTTEDDIRREELEAKFAASQKERAELRKQLDELGDE